MLVSYDLTPEEQQAVEEMLLRRRISIAKKRAKNFLFGQYGDSIAYFIAKNCNDTNALATLLLKNYTRELLINFILDSPEKFFDEGEINQIDFFNNLPSTFNLSS